MAALLYGALALWQLRRWNEDGGNRRLVAAFAVTSAWTIFVAFQGPHSLGAGIAEAARNFAFLGFMYALVSRAADERGQNGVRLVYAVVAGGDRASADPRRRDSAIRRQGGRSMARSSRPRR